tara:strand:- start:326 stop:532 length:207 start_codon:yes stop_codon:yes gene_type:complete
MAACLAAAKEVAAAMAAALRVMQELFCSEKNKIRERTNKKNKKIKFKKIRKSNREKEFKKIKNERVKW